VTLHDVLVVGGGPAGASTAYWLAEAGHDVVVLERKTFPREKTCGDGLTPRAVKQLADMGVEDAIARDHHRFDGLRAVAHGITLELRWPEHPVFPSHGYVVRRRDLDQLVADHAVKAGATLWQGAEAVGPVLDRGLLAGANVKRKDTGDKPAADANDETATKTMSGVYQAGLDNLKKMLEPSAR